MNTNSLKQFVQAKKENPQLSYWEFKGSSVDAYAGGGTTKNNKNQVARQIYQTARGWGMDNTRALALVGSLQQESGLNPQVTNSIGAYGLQQWLGSRKRSLFKQYGNHPTTSQQLEFLRNELTTNGFMTSASKRQQGIDYKKQFMTTDNLYSAIEAHTRGFSRPAEFEMALDKRYNYAVQFAQNNKDLVGNYTAAPAKQYSAGSDYEPSLDHYYQMLRDNQMNSEDKNTAFEGYLQSLQKPQREPVDYTSILAGNPEGEQPQQYTPSETYSQTPDRSQLANNILQVVNAYQSDEML